MQKGQAMLPAGGGAGSNPAGTTPAGPADLLVIGGGANGCGIARDAAGRGMSVTLAEMGDLASATSSASTKLFHGGLRYLEYLDLPLVREALAERDILLRSMPHVSWPLRFVMPLGADMRFAAESPVSRILGRVMPWTRGRRPEWLIRSGLWLYDHLGGRRPVLPRTRALDLKHEAAGIPLRDGITRGFEYSDCWVDDSRMVALCARDAAMRGARILTRTKVTGARREGGLWQVELTDIATGQVSRHAARALVNAAGPWVEQVLRRVTATPGPEGVRLVRGSHIVTRRLFDHDRCYILQGSDGRIVFAIPYEQDFTLIGTTDEDHPSPDIAPECTRTESDYLRSAVNAWFRSPVAHEDVVWSFSGLRPLHDDHAASATAVTRDYALVLDAPAGLAPLLSVFGGKITTHRHLAEEALHRLAPLIGNSAPDWTRRAHLPGGNFPLDGFADLDAALRARHPFLDDPWRRRLLRAYGTDAEKMLAGAESAEDLGEHFGATLTAREVDWMTRHEFARTADDVLWRRSKLGLRLSGDQVARLAAHMGGRG
ncbi:homodimeric glycerol 3-phosphate dehydrogenase (quinone) [Pontibaca methylaminivorans]|uniref:Glycerol-3-phosphate dehydrogenase n=2 Tax=Pontibaca methylaminivorans TaxID=515897 RepID=A0A1R3WK50_9RHOB|nr:homodimeric glycerol 3-phosphate dehydrogenase (quinone) [Pontibaca methylaminivorans]